MRLLVKIITASVPILMLLLWTIDAIKDINYCIKTFRNPLDHVDKSTEVWLLIAFTLVVVVFVVSALWAWEV